jgi:hypothetical protein
MASLAISDSLQPVAVTDISIPMCGSEMGHVIQPPVFVTFSWPHFGHRLSLGFHSVVKLPRDWHDEQAIPPKSADAMELPN